MLPEMRSDASRASLDYLQYTSGKPADIADSASCGNYAISFEKLIPPAQELNISEGPGA